jgi:hypothetical protein
MRVTTKNYTKSIDDKVCTETYHWLKDNVPWVQGIPSKEGSTRLAYPVPFDSIIFLIINPLLCTAIKTCNMNNPIINAIYLNYYRNGEDWTPNHIHKNTTQIIVSLGTDRTLLVGKKEYNLTNGDVTIFGSSVHGVPKDIRVTEGRISIALFLSR